MNYYINLVIQISDNVDDKGNEVILDEIDIENLLNDSLNSTVITVEEVILTDVKDD